LGTKANAEIKKEIRIPSPTEKIIEFTPVPPLKSSRKTTLNILAVRFRKNRYWVV